MEQITLMRCFTTCSFQ